MTMKTLRILSTALLALGAVAAKALTLTLDAPVLSASAGDIVTFTGTLLNDDGMDLFIAGDSITQDVNDPQGWVGLTIEDTFLNDFLFQYPDLFPAGASYTGALFSVKVEPTATARLNAGNFALVDDQGTTLANQSFAVDVRAVPEPASSVVLLGGVALLRRRKR